MSNALLSLHMINGLSIFATQAHAVAYYAKQRIDAEGVRDKIALGEITLGRDQLPFVAAPSWAHWDCDGRAYIAEMRTGDAWTQITESDYISALGSVPTLDRNRAGFLQSEPCDHFGPNNQARYRAFAKFRAPSGVESFYRSNAPFTRREWFDFSQSRGEWKGPNG